jgi:hypothetical protein
VTQLSFQKGTNSMTRRNDVKNSFIFNTAGTKWLAVAIYGEVHHERWSTRRSWVWNMDWWRHHEDFTLPHTFRDSRTFQVPNYDYIGWYHKCLNVFSPSQIPEGVEMRAIERLFQPLPGFVGFRTGASCVLPCPSCLKGAQIRVYSPPHGVC